MTVMLPPLPERIKRLPKDARGFPVPWFVVWYNGQPDFRITDADIKLLCITERRCWICGEPLDSEMCFVTPPICAVYRDSTEPPSHRDCGLFAARICPFLTKPRMRRREHGMPDESIAGPGDVDMTPGAALLWITRSYRTKKVDDEIVFEMGEPIELMWLVEGRNATWIEALKSIESQLSMLIEPAKRRGPLAVQDLRDRFQKCLKLLPPQCPV